MPPESFEKLLSERLPSLSPEIRAKMNQFRDCVLAENEKQNLTRLTSPEDFLEGHVLDTCELLKVPFLRFPAMDLGSGVGVPGLLAAILGSGPWILCESEGRKAEFLQNTVRALGLTNVRVFAKRGEDVLRTQKVGSVVCRAVGPVERIYGWLRDCSTWNNLVLLKGPKWKEEWDAFEKSKRRGELQIEGEIAYSQRVIVSLIRNVPRGT